MSTTIKNATAVFGGAVAVVFTLGFAPGGVSPTSGTSTPATHPSSGATSMQTRTPAPGVHIATLTGCIPGANC